MWKIPEKFRVQETKFGEKGLNHGAFEVQSPDKSRVTNTTLFIIATNGDFKEFPIEEIGLTKDDMNWEHVSVHAFKRINKRVIELTPTWAEMAFVKSLFWDDEDAVIQFHPPKSLYVNQHPHTLHLWRNERKEIPLPPPIFVGIKK